MFKIVILLSAFFMALRSFAFTEETTRTQYIEMWKEEAIYQMAAHGIPASITLAQGILESRDGNSRLAKEGNNHFGIKCHSDWEGKRIFEDDETRNECFRRYDNARESFDDHSSFLKKSRYASLFELRPDDYEGWAKGLRECGYATNPDYAKLLIRIIEENELTQYDEIGLTYAKSNTVPARKESTPEASVASNSRSVRKPRLVNDKDERSEIVLSNNHEIRVSDNNIKYIVVKEGETKESIARDIDLNVWILNKFNDFEANTQPAPGDIVYLQPKRNKANVADYTVQSGDTWFSISQKFGIKLKQLRKLNTALGSGNPTPGVSLKLKKP
jgi:flagellum-specific peptidoglycan hydrolase FlgJ